MICDCMHCAVKYDNHRSYRTSICNECFKKLNENQLQPLKDNVRELEQNNKELRNEIDRLMYGQDAR